MKKLKYFVIIFIAFIMFEITVSAADLKLRFYGEELVEPEKIQTLTIRYSGNEKIGVVEGRLNFDSGIEIVKVEGGKDDWTVTYNEKTGKFNTLKAIGGDNNEDLVQISYKLKDTAPKGNITLKEIEITTLNYETIEIEESVTKTIFSNKKDINITNIGTDSNNYENSDTLNVEQNKTDYTIFLIIGISVVAIVVIGVLVFKKVIKK